MKSWKCAGTILLMLCLAVPQARTQQSTTQFEIGAGAGGLLPVCETKDKPIDLAVQGYVIIPFTEMIKAELNVGYGQYYSKYSADAKIETDIIPYTVRFRFYPIVKSPILPYLYIGLGATSLVATLAYGAALGRVSRTPLLAGVLPRRVVCRASAVNPNGSHRRRAAPGPLFVERTCESFLE